MKLRILVLGFIWAGAATAADNKSLINDLIWTHPMQSEAITYLNLGQTSSKTTGDLSSSTIKADKSDINVTFGYGVYGDLSLLAALDYQKSSSTISGQSYTYNSSGMSNPLIGAEYQQVLTKDLMYNVLFTYSPSTGDHYSQGQGKTGDAKRGGDETQLAAAIGNIYDNFGYQVALSLKQPGKSTTIAVDDSQTKSTSTMESNLLIFGEYFVNKDIAVGANIDFYTGATATNTNASGSSTKIKFKTMQPLYELVAGYAVLPRSNVRLIVGSSKINGTTSSNGTDSAFAVNYSQYKLQWVFSF